MMKNSTKNRVVRKVREKPLWDSTVSDLNVYKLTPEELLQRKIDHISKNQQINFPISDSSSTQKSETVYDRLSKIRYGNQMKDNDISQRQKFVSGMFTSEKELFDLFEQSEKTLSTVESMFGDPLKRYKVKPTLTPAPNVKDVVRISNTNNNNCQALNEYSDSESESSKSAIKSSASQSVKKDDDLSKFRDFIEHERRVESAQESRRNANKSSRKMEAPTMIDAGTETSSVNDVNAVLQYAYCRLTDANPSSSETIIEQHCKESTDKIINHLVNLDRKNSIKIELLNADLNKNKELIDALTLELISNNEHMKRMKNEFNTFSKNVTSEISGMKSLLIKYLDQRVLENAPTRTPLMNSIMPGSSSTSTTPRSRDIVNPDCDIGTNSNEEILFKQQLNCLQLEHQEAQKRLKSLLKIQDSL